jgi:hypothetical protein
MLRCELHKNANPNYSWFGIGSIFDSIKSWLDRVGMCLGRETVSRLVGVVSHRVGFSLGRETVPECGTE